MKVSAQFPMKTESENVLRSLPFAVANAPRGKQMGIAIGIANRVKKQRAEVRRYLDSQLPRLRRYRPVTSVHGEPMEAPNFFRVTLIRISAGTLDTGNLWSALKNVQDEVAAWLGIDDSARSPASWKVAQQKGPAKVYAVRIEIEDDDPDPREVHRIVGPTIARLGPVVGDTAMQRMNEAYLREVAEDAKRLAAYRAERRRDEERQKKLVYRKAYFVAAEDGDDITVEELTGPLFEAFLPPPRIRKSGRVLVRRLDFHPALGEHWIYEAAPSAAPPSRRAEARR